MCWKGGNGDCVSAACADGVCCNSACNTACRVCNQAGSVGTCINITSGTDNSPANVCVAPNVCDAGGSCKKANGQACPGGNTDCASNACVDGFCCGVASCGMCQACTGANGTCVNIASGQPDNVPAGTCAGNNACDGAGACKLKNGQSCGGNPATCASGICADTLCCNNACNGTCQACNLGPAFNGTCTNITVGQDLDTCTGTSACNAASQCKKLGGQPCPGGNGDCLNNTCADGVCCNNACNQTCQACNLGGTTGTCTNITVGQDTDTCTGTSACNAASQCKKVNGQACPGGNGDCVSNQCVDGFCCSVAACGVCQACTGAAGACVNIATGLPDNVPANTCTGNNACDGSANCKLKNGQACGADGSICASGICADGLCCNNACTADCQACNLGGASNGVCTNIVVGDDTDTCNGNMTCSALAQCKLKNNQNCAANSDCASNHCDIGGTDKCVP